MRRKPTLNLNGQPVELTIERGYARIERKWAKGDNIQLHLPMPVRRVKANAQVQEDRAMVALQRGPLVYCAEWPDNNGHVLNLIVPENAKFESQWHPELLNGVQVVTGAVEALQRKDNERSQQQPHQMVAIPYFSWSNRGPGGDGSMDGQRATKSLGRALPSRSHTHGSFLGWSSETLDRLQRSERRHPRPL